MRIGRFEAVLAGVAVLGLFGAAGEARADTVYTYQYPGNTALQNGVDTLTLNATTGTGTFVGGATNPTSYSYNISFTFNPSNLSISGPLSDPSVSISSIAISPKSYVEDSGNINYYNATATTNPNLQVCDTQCGNLASGQTGSIVLNGVFGNGQNALGDEYNSVASPWSNYTPPSTSTSSSTGGTDVPEPGVVALYAMATIALAFRRRFRANAA